MVEGKVLHKQQIRRVEIVAAAQKCLAEKGLHGASVADIARQAGLSVGQLYRIFASKEEIVEAIVSEIVNARVGEMVAGNHDLVRMASVLAGVIPATDDTKTDNYLLMEINAEASRNPRLRKIMRQADRRLKEEGGRLTRHYHPEMSAEQINVACEFIAILTEGAAYRCELATTSTVDKTAMEALYRNVFHLLFMKE
ncbi:TetR family transcriptional regulator [Klebsiella sp. RHBSTW-00484]|uniref:TetR/AcrR family transcriptional regulator n=1 Tax=unclassified Klebsiella TaxID=2608929 RepID=UPI0015E4B1D3|nr:MULTISPECIES: TetR/AcrR family transcriptional regulator [unclassified Klebsiella]MBA7846581.1 TetR family transcriptional regulator [Klebsiella sp. RHBSTW-00465]QLO37535.1 TetR family transcriptional regulator [Klebsiella sp. RHBSTW-00484]QLT77053.1 TetR family transcriptional regulator [Klebsiella sp. RHBSTW-00464]